VVMNYMCKYTWKDISRSNKIRTKQKYKELKIRMTK